MTYEYKFLDTGEVTEVQHPMSQDALTEIDGRAVKRLISRSAGSNVVFKGHDWPDKQKSTSRLYHKEDKTLGVR